MESIVKLLSALVVGLTLIAAFLGALLVLDMISTESAREALVKTVQLSLIVAVASGVIIGIMRVNR